MRVDGQLNIVSRTRKEIKRHMCPSRKQNDCDGTGEVDFKQLPHIIVGSGKPKFCRANWKAKGLGGLLLQF